MVYKFEKERAEVLLAAKEGIRGNLKLSGNQKRYVKNLLLFALMRASENGTVTPKNFLKLVNKTFKDFLLKIIAENDDDDTDWTEALEVELNNIIADDELLKNVNIEEIITPETIISFLKKNTNGVSQKDLLKQLAAVRNFKVNYRETPEEERKRKQRQKEYELAKQRERMMNRERQGRGEREI